MVLGVSLKLFYSKSPNFARAKWFQIEIQIDFYIEGDRLLTQGAILHFRIG